MVGWQQAELNVNRSLFIKVRACCHHRRSSGFKIVFCLVPQVPPLTRLHHGAIGCRPAMRRDSKFGSLSLAFVYIKLPDKSPSIRLFGVNNCKQTRAEQKPRRHTCPYAPKIRLRVRMKRAVKQMAARVSATIKLIHAPAGPMAGTIQSVRMRMQESGNPMSQ